MTSATGVDELRIGWASYAEAGDPLAALTGWLLRAEMASRLPGFSPLLCYGPNRPAWDAPGFTGELAVGGAAGQGSSGLAELDLLAASGASAPAPVEMGEGASADVPVVAVAPYAGWELDARLSVGPPFGIPEPALLAARHLPAKLNADRVAYLRVVQGLPSRYVLVEPGHSAAGGREPGHSAAGREPGHSAADSEPGHRAAGPEPGGRPRGGLGDQPWGEPGGGLEEALEGLTRACSKMAGNKRVEVVRLAPGPLLLDDPEVEAVLLERRVETEEGRYQPEDWPGYEQRATLPLRVSCPLDLVAAVAGAEAVVASTGPLLALAWSLGVPHVALAEEESPAGAFVAWTGDATALAVEPSELTKTIDHVLARRGTPPGLKRLEAIVDHSLDEAAETIGKRAGELAASGRTKTQPEAVLAERVQELRATNDALRQRLAAERLLFAERASLLERTAHSTVESAIQAVQGQDVGTRRRLEVALKEMKRLQDETAEQQAELRAIHGTAAWRALQPARQWYERLRRAQG